MGRRERGPVTNAATTGRARPATGLSIDAARGEAGDRKTGGTGGLSGNRLGNVRVNVEGTTGGTPGDSIGNTPARDTGFSSEPTSGAVPPGTLPAPTLDTTAGTDRGDDTRLRSTGTGRVNVDPTIEGTVVCDARWSSEPTVAIAVENAGGCASPFAVPVTTFPPLRGGGAGAAWVPRLSAGVTAPMASRDAVGDKAPIVDVRAAALTSAGVRATSPVVLRAGVPTVGTAARPFDGAAGVAAVPIPRINEPVALDDGTARVVVGSALDTEPLVARGVEIGKEAGDERDGEAGDEEEEEEEGWEPDVDRVANSDRDGGAGADAPVDGV